MIKPIRLSIIASLLMGSGMVLAANVGGENKTTTPPEARAYTVPLTSSLYQLALQSGISVAQLRTINKGSLDRRDTLNAGESLLLPASSPLFPAQNKDDLIVSNLPELGMGNTPLTPSDTGAMKVAGTLKNVGSQDWNTLTGDQVKNQAGNWAKNQAKAQVVAPLQQGAQDFLGKFGKAQVGIAVDDKGSLKNSTAALFTPWYENDDLIAFSQVGIHRQDDRTIGNLGVGVRLDRGNWMWGLNSFIDQDLSRNHTRGGVGGELWMDNAKLAANYYHPVSGWKDSKDFDDYLERPASGFDVRAQGYLPAHPQLGASVVYEKYYGDEVALFGKENLQSDPHAVTLGVDYTPVPLLTLKVSHKEGQGGKSENKADLLLSYQLGTPLAKQLDPGNVALARSLKGSRYDLVDRNYDIVLEYKEKDGGLSLDLAAVPADLLEGDDYIMQPLVRNKYAIAAVSWNGDVIPLALTATAGATNPQGWKITLPDWDSSPEATNTYTLSITLVDEKGHQVTSNPVDIVVGHQRQSQLALESASIAPASGLSTDSILLAAYLENHQGVLINDAQLQPTWLVTNTVSGAAVPWVAPGETCPVNEQGTTQTCLQMVRGETEDRDGINHHVVELVSTLPGTFEVKADLGAYGMTAPQTVSFTLHGPTAVVRAEIQDPQGQDILTSGTPPNVGVTYSVKLFDVDDIDITTSIPEADVHWALDGANTAGCAVTLNNHDTGVTGYQFTPRVNADSNSGVACGDQGFGLKVNW
ncbi:inverse autotransporter beta domain-containing protein [Yersinia rohdei]|uniref:inverse autotransporter beta domain-containing protein n=1 Tax=Yersinia rohdei TaxID=29485 RepID=UPI0011A54CEC|nr:inverse autotransporter beta domain-containing protein [Yersinia rohdei]